jgi:predicted enzyme related to lactoylglutathione lyase
MLKDSPIRAYIPATNITRARKFYEELIGLRAKAEYGGGVVYECAGTDVFMYPTSNAGTSRASQAFWQVKDVEAEVAELKARGVKFEEYDMPGLTMNNSIVDGWRRENRLVQGHRGKHSRDRPTVIIRLD